MAKLLKLRRGTTTQHGSFTGAEGEVTIDTTKDTAVVHDGSQAGGRPLAREDLNNVSSSTIAGRLSNDSIAVSKIAAGTLPSDVKVTDSNVSGNLTIVNADVTSSAAIAGTKISPNFGSQNIVTTGTLASNDITISDTSPTINFVDTNNNSDFKILTDGGLFKISDTTNNNADRIAVHSDGEVDLYGHVDIGAGLDITGNMTVTGTVDGRDVAADGTKLDGIESSATADQTAAEILTAIKTVDGAGSGLDADLLDGVQQAEAPTASTIVKRNSAGNIYTNHVNTTASDVSSGVTKVMVETGNDNFIRHGSDAAIRSFINVENGATADQSASEIVSLLSDQNIATTGTLGSGDLTITGTQPAINFVDSDNNPDYKVRNSNGGFIVTDTTNSVNRIIINTDGHIDIANNVDFAAGIDVTGNITATGTVDGRDVAADGTKLDGIEASATADQTGAEIASALNGQDVLTTGIIGRDSNDYIHFGDNSKLDININGSNEFRFEADGDFHADGDVYAFSTTVASDENLKKDIVTVADAVTKVEALKGVTFKWNKNDAESAGVIAQDVEKVLPQAVKTVNDMDGNEYKAVNYSGLTSILIEAIKDLSARVKVLEAK